MSPAAVDAVQSQVTSKSSSSSSLQNPNHNDHQKPSIFSNATELPSMNGLRARPRMVKVRKQSRHGHGRSKAVSGGEFGLSGFNPFKLGNEGDCNCSVNGNVVEKYKLNEINFSSASFVFGATASCSDNSSSSGSSCSTSKVFDLNVEPLSSKVEENKEEKNFENEGKCNVDSPGGFVFRAKQRDTIENEGKKRVSKQENGKPYNNVGFVFGGASGKNVQMKSGLEKIESEDSVLHNVGKVSFEAEHGKDNFVSFEFGADKNNSGSNFNFEKGEYSGSGSDARPDSENGGFIVGATQNNNSRTNVGFSGIEFIFDKSWFNSNDKNESGGSIQNFVSNETGEMKVEGETACDGNTAAVKFDNGTKNWVKDRDEVPHVFATASSSKNSSSSTDFMATNFPNEVKSISETSESSRMASATNSGFNLSDEMKKLKLDSFGNIYGADNKESSANDDPLFVFRSKKMAEASSNGILGSTCEQSPEVLDGAAKGKVGELFESTHKTERTFVDSASVGTSSSGTSGFRVEHAVSSAEGHLSHGQVINGTQLNGAAAPSSFSLFGLDSQGNMGVPETVPTVSVGKENNGSSSASTSDGLEVPFTDLKTPIWDPSCLKASLFPELNKKLEFSIKRRSKKDKKAKTMRGRLKQLSEHKQHEEQDHVKTESSFREALNSPGCYSPMDFSPYDGATAPEIFSGETSMTSDDFIHPDNNCTSSVLHSTAAGTCKAEKLDLDKGGVTNRGSSVDDSEKCLFGDSPATVFGFEMPFSGGNTQQVCSSTGAGVASVQDGSALNTESNHQIRFGFASGLEDIDGRKFSFSSSSSTPKRVSAAKRVHRKNGRRKVASEPFVVATNPNVKDHGEFRNNCVANDWVERGSASSTTAIQEACETWRLRGNHAYKNGDLLKAEDSYTRGINSVPSSEMSGCCLEPLVVCYSNRAATRMSLGNFRKALKDCAMAAALDPRFLKVQMRSANCHLALGEFEKAQHSFNKCLESGTGVCLDRRIAIEAADGLQKCQKMAEYMNQSLRHLDKRTSEAALSALDVIVEASSISPYSERLLEMKAESLIMLRRYEEVIQLCEQTLHAAEKNFTSSCTDDDHVNEDGSQTESPSFASMWRWGFISKSYFYLGRLEVALGFLEKLEQMGSISDNKCASKVLESSVSLAETIRALIHHKNAGNEAVRSGRYTKALEHYTTAITSNIDSRPFAAICFGNRAAAHQALSQIADAIADCSIAIALDGNYSKAVARRAALHEMIRDYGQAANDLQRLIKILENSSDGKARQSGTPSRSPSSTKEIRQAHQCLSSMEEEAKKGIPLDLYLILGVEQSDTAADIKKAYRKAALRHHPDKAGQFLARSDGGDEGRLWKDIIQEVHMDADRLFKMIGESYAVLSDPSKRSEYDHDEEIRKALKEYNGNPPPRRPSDSYNYSWRTYGHSCSRW